MELEGMILGKGCYTKFPFRLILDILEFVELKLLKMRNYTLLDFYGFFSEDKQRKIFLVFSSLSIGYSSQLMEELPFGSVRNLRCHYLQIPEKFLQRCTKLEGLFSAKVDPENLSCIRRKDLVRNFDVQLESNHLSNVFVMTLNNFPNLFRVKLVSWKHTDQTNPLSLITNELSLENLKRLDIDDFPPFVDPTHSNFMIKLLRGNTHKGLRVLTFTSCDISNEILLSLQGNTNITELQLNLCIIRSSIIQLLSQPPKNLRVLSISKSKFQLVDTNNWERFFIPSEREDYVPSKLEVLDVSRVNGLPNHFFSEIRKFEFLKHLNLDNCNLTNENVESLIHVDSNNDNDEERMVERNSNLQVWKSNDLVVVIKGNKDLSPDVLQNLENKFRTVKK